MWRYVIGKYLTGNVKPEPERFGGIVSSRWLSISTAANETTARGLKGVKILHFQHE